MQVSQASPVVGFVGVLAQKDAAHSVPHAPVPPLEPLLEPELLPELEPLLDVEPLLEPEPLEPEPLDVEPEPLDVEPLLEPEPLEPELLPELEPLLWPASLPKPGVVAVLEQPLVYMAAGNATPARIIVTRNRFTASSQGYGAAHAADARLACLTSRFRGSSMSRGRISAVLRSVTASKAPVRSS